MFTGRRKETSVHGELGRSVSFSSDLKSKSEELELMIDSGCFGHVCSPRFAP